LAARAGLLGGWVVETRDLLVVTRGAVDVALRLEVARWLVLGRVSAGERWALGAAGGDESKHDE
jgi:hypothetical protein